MNKKLFLTGSIIILFISISFQPVSAQMTSTQTIALQEATMIEKFMDEIECAASESQTYCGFVEKLQDLCLNSEYTNYTIVREFILKILPFLITERGTTFGGINLYSLLEKFSIFRSDYFVISYGFYNRLSPWKENSIDLFKLRLSMWRYSDTSNLLHGRTLILERHPFGIHQKMVGPHLGFMRGFKGIYLDIENTLTGDAFVIFMGRVDRIQVFNLTSLSK